jgi:hypothetical protein
VWSPDLDPLWSLFFRRNARPLDHGVDVSSETSETHPPRAFSPLVKNVVVIRVVVEYAIGFQRLTRPGSQRTRLHLLETRPVCRAGLLYSLRTLKGGPTTAMTADFSLDDARPRSWAEAFPWLAGTSGVGALDWWNDSIEDTDPVTYQARLATISALAMERLTRWMIGQIFPGMPSDIDLLKLEMPARARNICPTFRW